MSEYGHARVYVDPLGLVRVADGYQQEIELVLSNDPDRDPPSVADPVCRLDADRARQLADALLTLAQDAGAQSAPQVRRVTVLAPAATAPLPAVGSTITHEHKRSVVGDSPSTVGDMCRLTMPGGLDRALLAGMVERASKPGFDRFQSQLRSSGYCARPVRLRGEVCTCDGERVWSTDGEPDGVLRKACGTAARRSARPARSATVRTPTT